MNDSTTCMKYTNEHQHRLNCFSNQLIEINLELLKQRWYLEQKFKETVIQYNSELIS